MGISKGPEGVITPPPPPPPPGAKAPKPKGAETPEQRKRRLNKEHGEQMKAGKEQAKKELEGASDEIIKEKIEKANAEIKRIREERVKNIKNLAKQIGEDPERLYKELDLRIQKIDEQIKHQEGFISYLKAQKAVLKKVGKRDVMEGYSVEIAREKAALKSLQDSKDQRIKELRDNALLYEKLDHEHHLKKVFQDKYILALRGALRKGEAKRPVGKAVDPLDLAFSQNARSFASLRENDRKQFEYFNDLEQILIKEYYYKKGFSEPGDNARAWSSEELMRKLQADIALGGKKIGAKTMGISYADLKEIVGRSLFKNESDPKFELAKRPADVIAPAPKERPVAAGVSLKAGASQGEPSIEPPSSAPPSPPPSPHLQDKPLSQPQPQAAKNVSVVAKGEPEPINRILSMTRKELETEYEKLRDRMEDKSLREKIRRSMKAAGRTIFGKERTRQEQLDILSGAFHNIVQSDQTGYEKAMRGYSVLSEIQRLIKKVETNVFKSGMYQLCEEKKNKLELQYPDLKKISSDELKFQAKEDIAKLKLEGLRKRLGR